MKKLFILLLLTISFSVNAQNKSVSNYDSVTHQVTLSKVDSVKLDSHAEHKKRKKRKTWDIISFGIFIVGTATFFIINSTR
jgi:hypothetical protein